MAGGCTAAWLECVSGSDGRLSPPDGSAAAGGSGTGLSLRPAELAQLPVIYLAEGLEISLAGAEARDGGSSHLLVQVPPAYERQQLTHQNDFCESPARQPGSVTAAY